VATVILCRLSAKDDRRERLTDDQPVEIKGLIEKAR
jgi:hypothetical protein